MIGLKNLLLILVSSSCGHMRDCATSIGYKRDRVHEYIISKNQITGTMFSSLSIMEKFVTSRKKVAHRPFWYPPNWHTFHKYLPDRP